MSLERHCVIGLREYHVRMVAIAQELDLALQQLSPDRAQHLEQLVREAILLVQPQAVEPGKSWPPRYFDETAGAFADETFERPPQSEFPQRDAW